MSDIIIRPAMERELEPLWNLQKKAFVQEAHDNGVSEVPPMTQCLGSFQEEFHIFTILAAEHEGRLVGMVRGREEKDTCYIGRLAVEPAMQQQGIGRRLFEAIEACFPQAKRFELFTGAKSERNIAFYQRRGYKTFRRLNEPLELVFMEKLRS